MWPEDPYPSKTTFQFSLDPFPIPVKAGPVPLSYVLAPGRETKERKEGQKERRRERKKKKKKGYPRSCPRLALRGGELSIDVRSARVPGRELRRVRVISQIHGDDRRFSCGEGGIEKGETHVQLPHAHTHHTPHTTSLQVLKPCHWRMGGW